MKYDVTTLQPLKEALHLGNIIGLNVDEKIILDSSHITLMRNVNAILHNFANLFSVVLSINCVPLIVHLFMGVYYGILPTNICLGFT